MKIRGFIAVATTVVLLLAVSACGSSDQGSQSDTITYWATNEGASVSADEEFLNKVVKDFEEQNDVTVEVKVVPWGDLYKNIITATTSGEGPDVLNIGNTWSAALQATGAFIPFDEGTMEEIGGRDKFADAPMRSTGAEGEPPASVPLYSVPDGAFFYNKAMFEEAGIQPPETWDEFIQAAEQLTSDTDGDGNIDQWGIAIAGGSSIDAVHRVFVFSRQQGGQFFNEQGEPTFNSPENVDAVKQYVDWLAQYKITAPAMANYVSPENVASFANGDAAMITGPVNQIANIESRGMEDSEFGVVISPVPEPLPEGGEPIRGYVSGSNISVFKNTQNRDAALQFVDFMTSKEQQLKLTQEFGNFPVIKSALDNPAYQGPKLDVFRETLQKSAPMPQVPGEGEMATFVGEAVVRLFEVAATTGSVSEQQVEDELNEAQRKMEAGGSGG